MPATTPIPAPTRRLVLQQLARVRLKEIVERLELDHQDAWSLEDLITVVLEARDLDFRVVLALFHRDELQLACDALGLDRGGRGNLALISRIMGRLAEPIPARPSPEPKPPREPRRAAKSDGDPGFDAALRQAAAALRADLDPLEGRHVVLGILFLKFLSDAFEALRAKLQAEAGRDPEDRAEYRAAHVFWIPEEARWAWLQERAKLPVIGTLLDDAVAAIGRENPALAALLPRDFARPSLDWRRLGELVELVGKIGREGAPPSAGTGPR